VIVISGYCHSEPVPAGVHVCVTASFAAAAKNVVWNPYVAVSLTRTQEVSDVTGEQAKLPAVLQFPFAE
jgi:hypothetical protein